MLKVLECGPADAQTKYGDTVLHLFMKNYYFINRGFCYPADLKDFLTEILSHNINPFVKNRKGLTASGIIGNEIPAHIYQSLHAYETAYKAEQDAIALAALGRFLGIYFDRGHNSCEATIVRDDLRSVAEKLSGGRQRQYD